MDTHTYTYQVLVVEDDPVISRSLCLGLPFAGFDVTVTESFDDGLNAIRPGRFDVILLDVNLPDGCGFDLCRRIRTRDSDIPILMLTANTSEEAAVTGMESGADDYIRKPYGINELTARMHRHLDKRERKYHGFGTIRVDPATFEAWAGSVALDLGKREFQILALLVGRGGEVITREEILAATDQNADIYDRTIDSHMSHLRKKMKLAGATERIVPVYGVGYRLVTL